MDINTTFKIQWFKSSDYQGYRKSIGYTLNRAGKKTQKIWYLGKDEAKAMQLAIFIKSAWKECEAKGNQIWTAEFLKRCHDFKAEISGRQALHLPKPSEGTEPGKKTFYQLIDEYSQSVIPTIPGERPWKENLADRMKYLKRCTVDFLIGQLDHQKLSEMVHYFKARPLSQDRNLISKTKPLGRDRNPISVDYVQTMIRTLKRLLTWLHDADKWQSFKGWEKLLGLQGYKPSLTDKERLAQSKVTAGEANFNDRFSIAELATLYKYATPQTRLYILFALNCGFTQVEISTLMRGEMYLDNDPPIIARARNKTTKINKPVASKWLLWSETIDACRTLLNATVATTGNVIQTKSHTVMTPEWKPKPGTALSPGQKRLLKKMKETIANKKWSETVAFEERDCLWLKPLVYTNENGKRIDLVKNAWFRLLNSEEVIEAKVRSLSFKYLRKTGADMIRELADESVAQLYLSHTPTTTASRHYINPQYDRLFEALKKMREKLNPIFACQDVPKAKPVTRTPLVRLFSNDEGKDKSESRMN